MTHQRSWMFGALICAVLGSAFYAVLAFGLLLPEGSNHFGTDIYDAYFYRLLEGRFDLPMRMLQFEGHYTADGVGIAYHGVAPLLTRAVLHPFVNLGEFPTAAFSVWLWSVVGTGFYHLSLFQVIRKYAPPMSQMASLSVAIITGLALWFSGAGMLSAANPVLYHEPISVAYAAMAAAVFLMVRIAFFEMPPERALVPLAILAGITLHARPHLAVGLYMGVVLTGVLALWFREKRHYLSVLFSIAILGFFAVTVLELNKARFGSATEMHGQINDDGHTEGVQFGPVFFETDYAVTGRGVVFRDHGRFHAWRVVPNLLVYTFNYAIFADAMNAAHLNVTKDISGVGHIERPLAGMFWIWTFWIFGASFGLAFARPWSAAGLKAIPLIAATGIAAGLMLSYPTVAFRYRIDLWPFVMTICLLSVPGLLGRFDDKIFRSIRIRTYILLALGTGTLVSMPNLIGYNQGYLTNKEDGYKTWDAATCIAMLAPKNFTTTDKEALCIDPRSVFAARAEG